LLNQLVQQFVREADPPRDVFTVGNTVQPETEDVSVYVIPACASPIAGTTMLLLDSPGLFSLNRLPVFDAQILAVLNLLSNVVLFNSLSMLDRCGAVVVSVRCHVDMLCGGCCVAQVQR
jgi:hypothetical protein